MPTPVSEIIVPKTIFNNPIDFLLGSHERGNTSITKNKIIQKRSIFLLVK